MSGFSAMLRKEWLEWRRTWKLAIVLGLFALVGLVSPLSAQLLPELLKFIPEDRMGGMELLMVRQPGVSDAMTQYLKNFSMLAIVALLTTMGTIAGELGRGTASMTLCKPVSRWAWLLAKAAVAFGVQCLGVLLAASGAFLYTTILFGELDIEVFALLNVLFLLQLWTFTAFGLLASAVSPSTGTAAGVSLGGFLLLSLLGAIPVLGSYLPAGLAAAAGNLVTGEAIRDLGGRVVAGLALCALLVGSSGWVLARKEL
jgi:ABC-2 type transport system permease protein